MDVKRRQPRRPPPAIVQRHVLEYALLPRSLPFTGTSIHLKHGDEPFTPLGRVPRLALSRDAAGVWLEFCDARWRHVAGQTYPTVSAAKQGAERTYPGSRRLWLKTGYSAAEFRRHVERTWAPYRCLFCLKTPLEWGVDVSLVKVNRGRICSSCVREIADDLAKGHQ